jgi:4'-phosphopantetheinyl transferase
MADVLHEIDAVHWEKEAQPSLEPGEIHVWRVKLDQSASRLNAFSRILSDSEKKQAARFRFAHLRARSMIVHGSLRMILSNYLGLVAERIEFSSGPGGKPALLRATPMIGAGLRFNLSHSEELLLVAISGQVEIGIDLERTKPEFQPDAVWKHFFGVSEQALLAQLPPDQQRTAFYRIWTCKEAVLKGEGSGIRRDLAQVAVSFDLGASTAHTSLAVDVGEILEWTIRLFTPAPEYTAALAYPTQASAARRPILRFFEWTS